MSESKSSDTSERFYAEIGRALQDYQHFEGRVFSYFEFLLMDFGEAFNSPRLNVGGFEIQTIFYSIISMAERTKIVQEILRIREMEVQCDNTVSSAWRKLEGRITNDVMPTRNLIAHGVAWGKSGESPDFFGE